MRLRDRGAPIRVHIPGESESWLGNWQECRVVEEVKTPNPNILSRWRRKTFRFWLLDRMDYSCASYNPRSPPMCNARTAALDIVATILVAATPSGNIYVRSVASWRLISYSTFTDSSNRILSPLSRCAAMKHSFIPPVRAVGVVRDSNVKSDYFRGLARSDDRMADYVVSFLAMEMSNRHGKDQWKPIIVHLLFQREVQWG